MQRLDLITLLILGVTATLSLVVTAFESYFSVELPRSAFLLQVITLAAIGWWIWADASRRRIPLGVGSALGLLFCFPAFFVFYGFRSRGRRGWILGAGAIGATLLYLVISVAIAGVLSTI